MTTTKASPNLKAPFPAFGGKSRIAHDVWARLGDVRNYIEPFCFSAAVLLKRPHNGGFPAAGAVETINDRNVFVTNFWRAVQRDPEAVAAHADWPVHEADLHARHRWLVASDEAASILQGVKDDPEAFDAKIAGWWCWGACCWIGSGWCDETHRNSHSETSPDIEGRMVTAGRLSRQLPNLSGDAGASGVGVVASAGHKRMPKDRRPGMSQAGWGVNACGDANNVPRERQPAIAQTHGLGVGVVNAGNLRGFAPDDTHRPQLADEFSRGRGVNGHDAASACGQRREWITRWMLALADRLRPVRVCCGHWSRVCDSPSTMTRLGTTGVFLDPPYRVTLACGKANRTRHIYANDRHQDVNALCDEVQAWCLRWGSDPEVRIALCGLEGEYPEIEAAGWSVLAWKSNGGYGNRKGDGATNENAHRERVWFSPACLEPAKKEGGLFA